MRPNAPVAEFGVHKISFQVCPDAITGAFKSSEGGEPGRVPTKEIRFLLTNITEARNVTAIRPVAIFCEIFEAFILRRDANPIIVKRDILSQQAVVIAEAIWKPPRGRVQ